MIPSLFRVKQTPPNIVLRARDGSRRRIRRDLRLFSRSAQLNGKLGGEGAATRFLLNSVQLSHSRRKNAVLCEVRSAVPNKALSRRWRKAKKQAMNERNVHQRFFGRNRRAPGKNFAFWTIGFSSTVLLLLAFLPCIALRTEVRSKTPSQPGTLTGLSILV